MYVNAKLNLVNAMFKKLERKGLHIQKTSASKAHKVVTSALYDNVVIRPQTTFVVQWPFEGKLFHVEMSVWGLARS